MIVSSGAMVKSPSLVWRTNTSNLDAMLYPAWMTGRRWASYEALYRGQHWVRTCVDKRADLLARLPLKVYRHDDLDRPEAMDHPYAVLLNRPNKLMGRYEFWRAVLATYDIYGEVFIYKLRDDGGRPNQLALLHPTSMREADETNDRRLRWDFDNSKVQISGIPEEDLIHPRTFNPSGNRGLSKLESLRATLENEEAAVRAQSAFWRNGARPGVALTHPGRLSQGAADKLKLRWDEVARGVDNVGSTVVLEEGMRPEILQVSAEEAQYIEARKLNREEVVAGFDMPPPAVHLLDHATYSNITEQMRSVYRDTVAPITTFFESELEAHLRGGTRPGSDVPDFGEEVYAEFLLDGVLRGDFEQRMDAYQAGINSGSITPAEVRKLENLPFIEGSNRLFVNSTMVPIEAAAPEVEDGAEPIDVGLVNAVGVLVRSGFDPASVLAALGLPPMEHLGLLPITLQSEDVFEADADDAGDAETVVRTVMGRLSRQKTLDEVDVAELVAGLNGHTLPVFRAFLAAKTAGADMGELRELIRANLMEGTL